MIQSRGLALALAGLLLSSTSILLAQPWSIGTSTEWFVTGDFNGDGLSDIVVVDRATGQYRVGWQKAPDNVGWSPAQPSGIGDIEAPLEDFANVTQLTEFHVDFLPLALLIFVYILLIDLVIGKNILFKHKRSLLFSSQN